MRESYRDFDCASIAELAERESIALNYMARHLRLTLLALLIGEPIVEGRQSWPLLRLAIWSPFHSLGIGT